MNILTIIDGLDIIKSAVISIISAITGTTIGVVNQDRLMLLIGNGDPSWFVVLAPYMQVIAWSVAITTGIVALCKISKKKK